MSGKWGGRPAARFRAFVLARDGYRCRMVVDGRTCGAVATTVQHVDNLAGGGARFDPANGIAACAPCNYREGGRLASRPRPAPPALTVEQAKVVQLLDGLAVPSDAGTRHATTRLAIGGELPCTRSDLRAATAWRRARGPAAAAAPSRKW